MLQKLILGALLITAPLLLSARDPGQVRAYRKMVACPATGLYTGPCKGYVVDHIVPLCLGGEDRPSNMIWQEKTESLEKDRVEWAMCRWVHRMEERKAAEGE